MKQIIGNADISCISNIEGKKPLKTKGKVIGYVEIIPSTIEGRQMVEADISITDFDYPLPKYVNIVPSNYSIKEGKLTNIWEFSLESLYEQNLCYIPQVVELK